MEGEPPLGLVPNSFEQGMGNRDGLGADDAIAGDPLRGDQEAGHHQFELLHSILSNPLMNELHHRAMPLINFLASYLPEEYQATIKQTQPEVLLGIVLACATILLYLTIRILSPSKSELAPVVLAGPCGAGKTALFYQLRDTSLHNGTVASMQENEGMVQLKGAKKGVVRMLDVPGHERLRHKLEQHLAEACAVVFVVDATDITPHKVEAAEELFEVLTHPTISKRRVPILLTCNKMDLETQAHSVDFVRRTVEKQLDTMRKTRTSLSPEAAAKASVLGPVTKPLTLSGLRNPVTVVRVSAASGDVGEVHAFLAAKR